MWSAHNEPLVNLSAGDRAVNKAVKTVCPHEAYMCRIRKEVTLKICSLRNIKRGQGKEEFGLETLLKSCWHVYWSGETMLR